MNGGHPRDGAVELAPELAVVRALPDAEIDLSIVVPAWNEAARLGPLLADLSERFASDTTEILVVDDGSADGTAAIATAGLETFPHGRVIRHDRNRGKGAAVRTGIAEARGRVVAFVDADNATDVEVFASMAECCRGRVGAVFGSRHHPESDVTGAPAWRGVMGRLFNHLVRFASGSSIRDTQCGAKVFRAPVAALAFSHTTIDGFAFDVEVLRRVLALGFEVVEHPVRWRHVAGTKVGVSTPLRMLVDIVRLRRRNPMPQLSVFDVDGDLAVVDDALRARGLVAECFRPETTGDGGSWCRLLLPAWIDPGRVAGALDVAGVGFRSDQSRTWLHDSGWSRS